MTFFLRFLVPMWCRNLSGRFSPPWLNRSTQYFAAAACELCVSCLSLSFVKLPQGHASFARSSGMLLSILVPLHTLVIFTSIKSLLLLRRRVSTFFTHRVLFYRRRPCYLWLYDLWKYYMQNTAKEEKEAEDKKAWQLDFQPLFDNRWKTFLNYILRTR